MRQIHILAASFVSADSRGVAVSMRPTDNGKVCPEKSSVRRWRRRQRRKRQGKIRPHVPRKWHDEVENEPDVQPDDDNRKVSDPSWSTRGEFPNDKVLHLKRRTPENPYPMTEEIARMWELDKTPNARMGRTRSNRF